MRDSNVSSTAGERGRSNLSLQTKKSTDSGRKMSGGHFVYKVTSIYLVPSSAAPRPKSLQLSSQFPPPGTEYMERLYDVSSHFVGVSFLSFLLCRYCTMFHIPVTAMVPHYCRQRTNYYYAFQTTEPRIFRHVCIRQSPFLKNWSSAFCQKIEMRLLPLILVHKS